MEQTVINKQGKNTIIDRAIYQAVAADCISEEAAIVCMQ
jgi:hypothetical protein